MLSRSIPQFLCDIAERLPDKVAIVSKTRSATFSQLHQEALATAACLRGIRLCCRATALASAWRKRLDQVSVILGVLFANAVVVPILPRLKQPNIRHIIENSGMVALVTDSDRMNEVVEFGDMTRLIVGHGDSGSRLAEPALHAPFIRPQMFFDRISNDNAAIIYSSGSTGRPKGILISHRNLADGADIVADYLETRMNTTESAACCPLTSIMD